MIIKSTKNFTIDNGLKILVYGEAGSGKTRLCATTGGTPLILSAESGLLSLKEYDFDYIEIKNIGDLSEVYRFVSKSEEAKKYDWICIDSLSEVAEICLASEKSKTKDARKAYGDMNEQMFKIIKAIRDLSSINIYMSCKIGTEKDDANGVLYFGPRLPGKNLSAEISYLFDEVFYLKSEINAEKERVSYLITSEDYNYKAKDRSGALSLYEEPSLKLIRDKILLTVKKGEKRAGN